MTITALAVVALILLLVTAAFGLSSLLAWSRHRAAGFPIAKIVWHIVFQALGIGVWGVFAVTGAVPFAWFAFVILTAGQVFGDLLMFASYRARHPDRTERRYFAIGGEVLSFARPAAALHALIGAIAWFGMLALSIYATFSA